MTSLAIALNQGLFLVALYRPLGAKRLGLPFDQRIGVGYLLSTALALVIGYALDVCGGFSPARQFAVWATLCALLNLLPGGRERPRGASLRGVGTACILLTLTLALSAVVHLASPLRNVSLAGFDAYEFVNFYAWIWNEHQAIHSYPSGFAVATSMSPWVLQPYEAVRWAPHWVFLAGLVASFGFWRQVGGLRFALLLTLLIGAAWPLYPLTAYYPLFIQWTFGFIGIPALLVLYARLAQQPSPGLVLIGMAINLTFAMTAGYFALYTNVLCLLLTLALLPKRRTSLGTAFSSALVALASVATLLVFYGVLARYYFDDWPTGIADQTRELNAVVAVELGQHAEGAAPAPATETILPSLLRTVVHFLEPASELRLGVRTLLYAGLAVAGIWTWRLTRSPRLRATRLLAGVLLISVFSAATGIFELPAWQGRSVFVSLYAGLAVGLWLALHRFAALARLVLGSPMRTLLVLAALVGPSVLHPPIIGRNVPISEQARPRHGDIDNRIMAEISRPLAPQEQRKELVLMVLPGRTQGLLGGLRRLLPRTRERVFPAYGIVPATNRLETCGSDAILAPEDSQATPWIPDGFRVHTQGAGVTFALRDPSRTP